MSTPESKVKRKVAANLRSRDAWFFMPVPCGLGRHGIPDFVCCIPRQITQEDVGKTLGLFVGIETKAPGKRGNTTPNQDREIAAIRAANGIAIVVDDVAQMEEILK